MSVFIADETHGVRMFRERTVNITEDGTTVQYTALQPTVLQIHTSLGRNFLRIQRRGVSYSGSQVLAGTEFPFNEIIEINLKKRPVKIWTSSLEIETLARSSIKSTSLFAECDIKLEVLHFQRIVTSLRVPRAIKLRCGSSANDALLVELPGVRKAHCEIEVMTDDRVRITPLTGSVNNKNLPVNLASGQEATLCPEVNLVIHRF